MSNFVKRVLMSVSGLLIPLFILGGCGSEREYFADIRIPLETDKEEIIIKEWAFLLGSGAEIYYSDGDKEVLMGKLSGADDGFCPFKEGLYEVTVEDDKVIIKWSKNGSDDSNVWHEDVFELPSV